jgi:hypothetical protein
MEPHYMNKGYEYQTKERGKKERLSVAAQAALSCLRIDYQTF